LDLLHEEEEDKRKGEVQRPPPKRHIGDPTVVAKDLAVLWLLAL